MQNLIKSEPRKDSSVDRPKSKMSQVGDGLRTTSFLFMGIGGVMLILGLLILGPMILYALKFSMNFDEVNFILTGVPILGIVLLVHLFINFILKTNMSEMRSRDKGLLVLFYVAILVILLKNSFK